MGIQRRPNVLCEIIAATLGDEDDHGSHEDSETDDGWYEEEEDSASCGGGAGGAYFFMAEDGEEEEAARENPILVSVTSVMGKLIDVLALPSDTVSDFKLALRHAVGVASGEYHLLRGGHLLNDFDVLSEAGVLDGTELMLVPQTRSSTW